MGRVLEALQRQQENQEFEIDPLAAAIGRQVIPEDDLPDFVLPDRIGSPVAPRSNEGTALGVLTGADLYDGNGAVSGDPPVVARGPVYKAPVTSQAPPIAVSPPPSVKQPERAKLAPITHEPPIHKTVALDPTKLHARLVLYTDPQASGCEQYRTLRTQIFHAAERQPAQLILVTSAIAGEGKTSTILNLAWAIAQSNEKRVLVIDSDLRRPSVSAYLGLEGGEGLGEVLNETCAPLEAVRRVADSTLYVLASARDEENSAELLSKARVAETFAELRQYFDFILVDAPPVVAFADTRLLANFADAIVVVVRAGLAGHNTIERAMDALPTNRILGVVLNGADQMSEVGYYGYYGYGYGYAYRKDKQSLAERLGIKPFIDRLRRPGTSSGEQTEKSKPGE